MEVEVRTGIIQIVGRISADLPAVGVVPVEGEVVGEPGVQLIQAHLLAGGAGEGLDTPGQGWSGMVRDGQGWSGMV